VLSTTALAHELMSFLGVPINSSGETSQLLLVQCLFQHAA
jgi:hypothetical protein